jgi:hypothetical protein
MVSNLSAGPTSANLKGFGCRPVIKVVKPCWGPAFFVRNRRSAAERQRSRGTAKRRMREDAPKLPLIAQDKPRLSRTDLIQNPASPQVPRIE